MTLGFCPFASSSSGNCYLIKSENTSVLVDVGISASQISGDLSRLGVKDSDISTVYLTHEHIDHIKSVMAYHKKAPQAMFVASGGTFGALADNVLAAIEGRMIVAEEAEDISTGDIKVRYFHLSHDAADPITYTFEKDGRKIALITDMGCITDEICQAAADSDILVLEANHEENILLYGRYPYEVKRRILSDKGHMSNETAGNLLCRVLREMNGRRVPQVFLAHLSKENNTPQQAFLTVKNILEEEDFFVGKDLELNVITPGEELKLTEV